MLKVYAARKAAFYMAKTNENDQSEKSYNIIQKSRPMLALGKSDITLPEFKILDLYLACINSHDPKNREVVLRKGEIENLLNVSLIKAPELKARLKNLMSKPVELPVSNKDEEITLIHLFERIDATKDHKSGEWTVKLRCTEDAVKYIFNIENLGYIKYKLDYIAPIRSRYTYLLFMYIRSTVAPFRKQWTITVDELKAILACDKEETYKAFKHFNDKILKRAQKEIMESVGLIYEYKPIKSGRFVKEILFTVISEPMDNMRNLPQGEEKKDIYDADYVETSGWEKELEIVECRLTAEQRDELEALLKSLPSGMLPDGNDEAEKFGKYLKLKVRTLARRIKTGKKPIADRYKYLIAMINKDIEKYASALNRDEKPEVNKGRSDLKNFKERENNNYTKMILERYSKKTDGE